MSIQGARKREKPLQKKADRPEPPRAAWSRQEPAGAASSRQEPPGAPKSRQEPPKSHHPSIYTLCLQILLGCSSMNRSLNRLPFSICFQTICPSTHCACRCCWNTAPCIVRSKIFICSNDLEILFGWQEGTTYEHRHKTTTPELMLLC